MCRCVMSCLLITDMLYTVHCFHYHTVLQNSIQFLAHTFDLKASALFVPQGELNVLKVLTVIGLLVNLSCSHGTTCVHTEQLVHVHIHVQVIFSKQGSICETDLQHVTLSEKFLLCCYMQTPRCFQ